MLQGALHEHAAGFLYVVATSMKERVEGELWSFAEVIAIFVPRHFLGVALEGETVNLVIEAYGGNRR